MATQTEDILIDIKIEGDNEKQIDELTSSIESLQKANTNLLASNKALAKSGQQNTQEYKDNARTIEINKQKIQENTASRKGLIQTLIAEDNSVKALQVRNNEMIKQRNLINTATDEGRKRIAALNSAIDSNNKVIQQNVSKLEQQKINIGNYASALDGVIPGLGAFTTGVQNLFNPVTALGTAVGALATAYFSTGRGAQDLEQIQFKLSATTEVLSNKVADFVDILKGDDGNGLSNFFLDAIPGARTFAAVFQATIGDSVDALAKIKDRMDDLDEARDIAQSRQNELLGENTELMEEIARSATVFADKQFLAGKAIDNIREGERLVVENKREQIALLEEEAKINKNSEAIRRQINALDREITQEQKKADKLVNNINKQVDNLKDSENSRLETIQKQNEKLQTQAELEQHIIDVQNSKFAEADLSQQEQIDLAAQKNDEDIRNTLILEGQTLKTDELSKSILRKAEADKKAADIGAKANKVTTDNVQSAIALSAAVLGLAESDTKAGKILAVSTIATNAAIGVSNAVKAGSGLVWPANLGAILSGITAVLVGITQAKGFLSKAAGGGDFVTTKPTLLLVGDNPGGRERVTVTPLSGRGRTSVDKKSGLVAMAGGGSLTVDSDTRSAFQQANSQFDLNRMASLINQVQTVLVLQDFEAKQSTVHETTRQATVI